MARILFAWELGGDYGHLARLIPVALALKARGHAVEFALRELVSAERLLGPHDLRWYQAPVYLGRITGLPGTVGYAELLMRAGFFNPASLIGIARAWRNLVERAAPDLLVLDHAPNALLATRDIGVPRVNLGSGFFIPPAADPLPPFAWWDKVATTRLGESEERVRLVANEALHRLGAPPLLRLAELLDCEATLLACFGELDHYPVRAGGDYVGPVYGLVGGAAPAWPEGAGPRVFAYLKPDYAGVERILADLRAGGARVLAHLPGASRQMVAEFSRGTMTLSPQPLDIDAVAREADLGVAHGGIGTVAAFLLAGRPVLLLPMHTEQEMMARRVEAQGLGAQLPAQATNAFGRKLKAVLNDLRIGQAARDFGAAHAGYDRAETVRGIVARCEALLGVPPAGGPGDG